MIRGVFVYVVKLLPVGFIHFVTDHVPQHAADGGTQQGRFRITADGLADQGAGCGTACAPLLGFIGETATEKKGNTGQRWRFVSAW